MLKAMSAPENLIASDLAELVLARALGKGGDFAEVFCEDRAGFAVTIDESRVEGAQRGGERGAGIRVVRATPPTSRTWTASPSRTC